MGWDTVEDHFASNLYYDPAFKSQAAKLLPGEFYFTNEDMLIVTVLGSCVSACIRDPVAGYGGMNHFMLPVQGYDGSVNGSGGSVSASMRYGDNAMNVLIERLLRVGGRLDRMEAKVFGGGNVLKGFGQANVGERNSAFVLEYLMQRGIRILAQDLNGAHPRKVYYFQRTGKVFVRKINELRNDTLVKREIEYASRLKGKP